MTATVRSLLVDRSDLRVTRVDERPPAPLEDGEALVRIDRVAITSNNVTYAAIADVIPYFEFFPSGVEGFGLLPVWGFGEVVASASDDLAEGERLFGIWPSSTHVVVRPVRRGPGLVVDDSTHRRPLPAFYRNYTPAAEDPTYAPDLEDMMCVFRPLFTTAFSIDDWLESQQFMGARRVLLSSASSKTAWATANRLSARTELQVVGLTSDSNVGFVERLGVFDQAVAYGDVAGLDDAAATVFVDFAGSADVRRAVRQAIGSRLVLDLGVGLSHWSEFSVAPAWSDPPVTTYFAPSVVRERMEEVGADAYMAMYAEAWAGFVPAAEDPLSFEEHHGIAAMRDRFADAVAGMVPPDRGVVIRPG